ncbi:MAG TPA: cytidylate kinase-like family protein [Candidatus Deferrimicrobium sp.]|nr:cytidylate kinase-like family protein [Candidatus Deferrimicrobium sp.]
MPIITITRGSLSISFKLKDKLSEMLGCRAVSREEIIKQAVRYGIEDTGLADIGVVETQPPHFWDRHAAQRRHYLTIFKAALMDFVADGNLIYHGHLGQFLLNDVPRLLRVRANAPMEFRVNLFMKESGSSETEARAYINQIDSRRMNWARFLYGVDFNDPANFDLILNMDKMSVDTMAAIVARAADQPEFTIDDAVLQSIKHAHLKATALAYLARSPRTRSMDLSLECDADRGHVKVRGLAPVAGSAQWEKDIRDVLAEVKEITSLDISA